MKVLLVVLALIGLGYYIYNNHSPFQTEVTDPYFIEIRIKHHGYDVELVGVGRMNSHEDCQARALMVWANTLEQIGEVSLKSKCQKELSKKYLKLFDNQQAPATYVVFEKGNDEERDGRFLFYGLPSSLVYEHCETVAKKISGKFTGKVYCIKGSVG